MQLFASFSLKSQSTSFHQLSQFYSIHRCVSHFMFVHSLSTTRRNIQNSNRYIHATICKFLSKISINLNSPTIPILLHSQMCIAFYVRSLTLDDQKKHPKLQSLHSCNYLQVSLQNLNQPHSTNYPNFTPFTDVYRILCSFTHSLFTLPRPEETSKTSTITFVQLSTGSSLKSQSASARSTNYPKFTSFTDLYRILCPSCSLILRRPEETAERLHSCKVVSL